nr:unknown protein [Saccharomyces cerevisiae]
MTTDNAKAQLTSSSGGNIIVVSNRLPVTITKKQQYGTVRVTQCRPEAGHGVGRVEEDVHFQWFGWPGLEIPDDEKDQVRKDLLEKFNAVPIFLSDEIETYTTTGSVILFYGRYSITILVRSISTRMRGSDNAKAQHQTFTNEIAKTMNHNDLIWVHDYHLMLVPEMLRVKIHEKQLQNVKVGWFLHTPFPSSEIYRILPVRQEILKGVLSCDLVGFHTYDYARHFLSSVQRVLNVNTLPNGVEYRADSLT